MLGYRGNESRAGDIDHAKVERLTRGDVPIFEPELAELVGRNLEAGRLKFAAV